MVRKATKLNHHVSAGLDQGEAKALLANVEFGVVLAHEWITENPERTAGSWNVNWCERKDAKRPIWDCGLLRVELIVIAPNAE